MKKTNKKLQLRVQTFENKLQLEQVKEGRLAATLRNTNEESEQTKYELDKCLKLVILISKTKPIKEFLFARSKLKKKTSTNFRPNGMLEKRTSIYSSSKSKNIRIKLKNDRVMGTIRKIPSNSSFFTNLISLFI